MAGRPPELEVAEAVRPHGLRGGVVVVLHSSERDRLVPGSVLYATGTALVVRAARPLAKDRFVVEFEGVATKEQAESLRGARLMAAPREVPGALWVDELIGARVRDRAGALLGVVTSVEANPASDLLVLDTGGLIPARFVIGEVRDGELVVEVPEGLL